MEGFGDAFVSLLIGVSLFLDWVQVKAKVRIGISTIHWHGSHGTVLLVQEGIQYIREEGLDSARALRKFGAHPVCSVQVDLHIAARELTFS
jgi:hypothetical protein